MPQLHVLPAVPSFGSKLADTLTGAIGNLGQGYMQGKAKQNDQTILQSIASNPNATAMDYISAFSQLSPESRQQLSPLVNTLLQTQSAQNIAGQKQEQKQAELAAKTAKEQQEKADELKGITEVLDNIDKNIPYSGHPGIPGKGFFGGGPMNILSALFPLKGMSELGLNRHAVEKREELTQDGFWAADKAYTYFNKGTVSDVKFKAIQDKLAPRNGLTERENQARSGSLRRVFSLPQNIRKDEFDKVVDEEIKKVNSIESPSEKKSDQTAETAKVKMLSPSGEPVDVPADKVKEAIDRKWILVK